jgi:hypothetical protein
MLSIIYMQLIKKSLIKSRISENFLNLQCVVLDDILILHFQQGSAPTFPCFSFNFYVPQCFLITFNLKYFKTSFGIFDIPKYLSKLSLVFTLKPPVYGYKYIEFRDFKNI